MKRIKSACLLQTVSFILDPNVSREIALRKVKDEVTSYKAKAGTTLQILKETVNEDGSVDIEIRKKVSSYSIGNYFD